MSQYTGIFGILVFCLIAWAFSRELKTINLRLVFWTLLMQIVFAFVIFRTNIGESIFGAVNSLITAFVSAAIEGPKFVFGNLADPDVPGSLGLGFQLFFNGLTTIIVISALLGILYYIGFMGLLLRFFSSVFSRLTRISGAESLAATANIIVGNESLLAIRPHLAKLTKSEYCTLLATCMATISANVLIPYVNILQKQFPSIGGHLVSASILSVPAAVLLAKLAVPEREIPETLGIDVKPHYEKENSLIEAVLGGGEAGFKMIVGITCMLIAVVGLISIANTFIAWSGTQSEQLLKSAGLISQDTAAFQWSIQNVLGTIFYPFTWLMGVPLEDIKEVSKLLGTRMIMTEIPAYYELSALVESGKIQPRSAIIAAYALCGFAHIPSMAIYVGGATALAPERKSEIASIAWKALIVATLACFMTGAIAGLFYRNSGILL